MPRHSLRHLALVAVAAITVVMSASLSAHHGWGGYSSKDTELTGVVQTPLSLTNPHATMKIKVDQQVWDLTLAPPASTRQSGLRENTIPVGALVTIQGHRHLDPKRFEVKTERVTYEGKTYNVYPDRE